MTRLEHEKLSESLEIKTAQLTDVSHLAEKLGVTVGSLERLDIAICKTGWVFPMRNVEGDIVGHRLRWWKGGKGVLKGGHLGLFIPADAIPSAVTVMTEGESDLAVAMDLGLPAIGRPSATACVAETVRYLTSQEFNGITIIADRDENPAGQEGAEQLAVALLEAKHPVRIVLPPQSCDDLRSWHLAKSLTGAQFWQYAKRFNWHASNDMPPGFFRIANWQLRRGLIGAMGTDAYAVLSIIGSFRDRNGLCAVSRSQIGRLIGKSVSTVDRSLKNLKQQGILELVARGHEGRTNSYQIHIEPFGWKKIPEI